MKVSLKALALVFLMKATTVLAGSQADQLEKAFAAMRANDFKAAQGLLMRVQNVPGESEAYRQARYYLAACKLQQKDYWAAEAAYRNFLVEFSSSDGSEKLLAKALFELGTIQNALGKKKDALDNFRKGSTLSQGNDPYALSCSRKAKELGDAFVNYSMQRSETQNADQGEADDQIKEIIELAKSYRDSGKKDETLLWGMKKAKSYRHIVMFLEATSNRETKDLICIHGVSVCSTPREVVALAKVASDRTNIELVCIAGIKTCKTVDDFIFLAKVAPAQISNNNAHDRILLRGTGVCATVDDVVRLASQATNHDKMDEISWRGLGLIKSLADAKKLAEAAASRPVRQKILDFYQSKLRGVSASATAAPVRPVADLQLDHETVARVQAFLANTRSGGNIEQAKKALLPSDYEISVVRDSLKAAEVKNSFDKVHGGSK